MSNKCSLRYVGKQTVDRGKVIMNYVAAGASDGSPLLLIPVRTESRWGYESVVGLLAADGFGVMPSTCGARVGRLAYRLVERAGQRFDYHSLPQMGHSMHKRGSAVAVHTLRY